MLAALLIFGVSAVAYRHGHMTITGKTVPGGIWLSPNPHFLATGSTLHFAAHACPARPSDPAIAYVNFTLSWPANGFFREVDEAAQGPGMKYESDHNL